MDNFSRTIKVGRTNDCDVRIKDKMISKVQFHIRVDRSQFGDYEWVLVDGINDKPSTNGTWLYINEDLMLFPGMVFKANLTIFKVGFK